MADLKDINLEIGNQDTIEVDDLQYFFDNQNKNYIDFESESRYQDDEDDEVDEDYDDEEQQRSKYNENDEFFIKVKSLNKLFKFGIVFGIILALIVFVLSYLLTVDVMLVNSGYEAIFTQLYNLGIYDILLYIAPSLLVGSLLTIFMNVNFYFNQKWKFLVLLFNFLFSLIIPMLFMAFNSKPKTELKKVKVNLMG